MSDAKPWEMNWSKPQTGAEGAKPWEMNWDKSAQTASSPDRTSMDKVVDTVAAPVNGLLNLLGYAGRVSRAGIDSAIGNSTLSDIKDQASHFDAANTSKPAVTGQQLLQDIHLPVLGVNPNFKGPAVSTAPVNALDALSGTDKNAPGYNAVRTGAGILAEGLTDPTPLILNKAVIPAVSAINENVVSPIMKLPGKAVGSIAEGIGNKLSSAEGEGLVGDVSRVVGNKILSYIDRVNPSVNKNLSQMIEAGESIGMSPGRVLESVPVHYGPDSDISANTSVLAHNMGGEQLRVSHNAFADEVANGLENKINDIANNRISKVPDDFVSRGKQLVGDFSEAQNKLRNQIDWDRGMVYKDNPNFQLSDQAHTEALSVIEKNAKALDAASAMKVDPTVEAQSKKAANILSRIYENASQTNKAADTHSMLQQLGDIAFGEGSERVAPSVSSKLKQTYFDLANVYDKNTAQLLGPEIADRVAAGNKSWSAFFKSNDDFSKTLASGGDPERVFQQLVKSGGSGELEKYKSFMEQNNPEGLQNMKAMMMHDLASKNGEMNFRQLLKNLDSPKVSGKLDILYTPEELDSVRKVAELGAEHGSNVINGSGTGRYNEINVESGRLTGKSRFIHKEIRKTGLEIATENLKRKADAGLNGISIGDVNNGKTLFDLVKPDVEVSTQTPKNPMSLIDTAILTNSINQGGDALKRRLRGK